MQFSVFNQLKKKIHYYFLVELGLCLSLSSSIITQRLLKNHRLKAEGQHLQDKAISGLNPLSHLLRLCPLPRNNTHFFWWYIINVYQELRFCYTINWTGWRQRANLLRSKPKVTQQKSLLYVSLSECDIEPMSSVWFQCWYNFPDTGGGRDRISLSEH